MHFFRNGLYGIILVNTLLFISSPKLIAATLSPTFIQKIDTVDLIADVPPYTLSIPDPTGIVYLPSKDAFLISDSEVDEMVDDEVNGIVGLYHGYNVFKVKRSDGTLIAPFSTDVFSAEATGLTINPDNGHCFFTADESYKLVFEVVPGTDGDCLSAGYSVLSSFDVEVNFDSLDPEDVTYGKDSNGQDALFLVDGEENRIYRISKKDGSFNYVETGDNELRSFDTSSLGLTDPEGVVFDATSNSLYIVGLKHIIQTTVYGVLLNDINLSQVYRDLATDRPNRPSGIALAPSSGYLSTNKSAPTSLYLVARGVDNNDDPLENDGSIHELRLPPTPATGNTPSVLAGDDQSLTRTNTNTAQLDGNIDDGLPTWSKYSGPGEVNFTEANNLSSKASFSMGGIYVLRLTGYNGEQYAFDDLQVTIIPDDKPPVLTLNGDASLLLNINEAFIDLGAIAIDNIDGDISAAIQTVSTVNIAVAGNYQVTYTVADSDGNAADSITRAVIIRDSTDSTIDPGSATNTGSTTTSGGGGSSDKTLLLLLAFAFLFRHQIRTRTCIDKAVK